MTRYRITFKEPDQLIVPIDYTVRNGLTDKWDASLMSTQYPTDNFTFISTKFFMVKVISIKYKHRCFCNLFCRNHYSFFPPSSSSFLLRLSFVRSFYRSLCPSFFLFWVEEFLASNIPKACY